jgi:hypothetical protein
MQCIIHSENHTHIKKHTYVTTSIECIQRSMNLRHYFRGRALGKGSSCFGCVRVACILFFLPPCGIMHQALTIKVKRTRG